MRILGYTLERTLIYILIFAVLITLFFIFYLFFSQTTKSIKLQSPNGGDEWAIGQTHKISWEAKGINRVGIVLFEGREPKWIAQNVQANLEEYEWKIYPGQEYGDNYWIAIFEYPWKEDSKIDFSDGAFAITYPKLASCEKLSVTNEWPHVPSDLPDLRRVFITQDSYRGNLGGLDGADRICQKEAEKQGFSGTWQAFLGGDSDDDLAVERIKRTARGTDGIFVVAKPEATLIRGETCHRLLAKDFETFLKILSELSVVSKEKLEKNFYEELKNVWLGRLDEKSKKSCIGIVEVLDSYGATAEKYSLSSTCQNWSTGNKMIEGYPVPPGYPTPSFPTCYTRGGELTNAVALGALASGTVGKGYEQVIDPYQGKYCDNSQKLLCIEE